MGYLLGPKDIRSRWVCQLRYRDPVRTIDEHAKRQTIAIRPTYRRRNSMAARSRMMISDAERRFPVRVRIAVPAGGFGRRLEGMHAWLDANCGAHGWMIT